MWRRTKDILRRRSRGLSSGEPDRAVSGPFLHHDDRFQGRESGTKAIIGQAQHCKIRCSGRWSWSAIFRDISFGRPLSPKARSVSTKGAKKRTNSGPSSAGTPHWHLALSITPKLHRFLCRAGVSAQTPPGSVPLETLRTSGGGAGKQFPNL